MRLRQYQLDLFWQIVKCEQERPLAVLPTGGGKTNIIAELVSYYLVSGKSVCVLVHRKELIEQVYDRLAGFNIPANVICASVQRPATKIPCWVASVQTIVNRPQKIDIVIIDEAHHASANTYKSIIEDSCAEKVIGFTATPCRLDGKPLGRTYDEFGVFDCILQSAGIYDLVGQGYLCPLEFRTLGTGSDSDITVKSTGDYDLTEAYAIYGKAAVYGDMLKEYERISNLLARHAKIIVFCCTITHAEEVKDKYFEVGINSAVIHSKLSKLERESFVQLFRKGEITVLVNVNILTEGFDCPDVDCVQVLRPTQSKAMYMQMVGRAMRPCAGKERGYIIDHTDNTTKQNSGMSALLEPDWSLDIPTFSHTFLKKNNITIFRHSKRVVINESRQVEKLLSDNELTVAPFVSEQEDAYKCDLVYTNGSKVTKSIPFGSDTIFGRVEDIFFCLVKNTSDRMQPNVLFFKREGHKKVACEAIVDDASNKKIFYTHKYLMSIPYNEWEYIVHLAESLCIKHSEILKKPSGKQELWRVARNLGELHNHAIMPLFLSAFEDNIKKSSIVGIICAYGNGEYKFDTTFPCLKLGDAPERSHKPEAVANATLTSTRYGESLYTDLKLLYDNFLAGENNMTRGKFQLQCYRTLKMHNAEQQYVNRILERIALVCDFKPFWLTSRLGKTAEELIELTISYYKSSSK